MDVPHRCSCNLGALVQGPSCSRAHLGNTAAELHLWAPCPYFWHLRQRNNLGEKGVYLHSHISYVDILGQTGVTNVQKHSISFLFLTLVVYPGKFDWCHSLLTQPSRMSIAAMLAKSRQQMTPCRESTNFWGLEEITLFFRVTLHQEGSISESLDQSQSSCDQGLEAFVSGKWW